jgi:hypothetical protein
MINREEPHGIQPRDYSAKPAATSGMKWTREAGPLAPGS